MCFHLKHVQELQTSSCSVAALLRSLLWACGVLRADLLPRMERQAPPSALLAVVAGLIAVAQPLRAILIGVALTRSALAPRTWLGLVLMAVVAAYLLLAPAAEPESTELSLH